MLRQYYNAENYECRKSVGYLLRHSSKLITSKIESLFVYEDISFVQYVILMNLRDGLAKTSAELCQSICHDSGALTRIIDQMEKRKFLKRIRSKQDRRIITLKLTKTGKEIAESFLPRVVQLYNSLLSGFTHQEADTLINLLTRLTDKLSEGN